ncbi:unnamed protein product [Eruca vesicaria subsp. sativa]|uniref:Uncharacterized protein n=1 Tax=Eruca vesicaria subsp. sativa TaxID=29727 RepID=A0ABC8M9L0_ERUVS|nr:unnamed protein product [Eruca vesicaria subsp. sativa]CAH8392545.1 unnamed protein product [Eruca vesicaria subsp. sativa]
MFSESQRIKYDIENETKEIPDARAYLLKLTEIRTRRGLTDELGAEAMMSEALEKVEKDREKPLLRSTRKEWIFWLQNSKKATKSLGLGKKIFLNTRRTWS